MSRTLPRIIAVIVLVAVVGGGSSLYRRLRDPAAAVQEVVEIRVAWWGNPVRDVRTKAVIELFEEHYPRISVHAESYSWFRYWDIMEQYAEQASLPDVMQHDYAYIRQYVQKGLLRDLSSYRDTDAISVDSVPAPNLRGGVVDGGLYGIGLGMNTPAVVYDPAVLSTAGIDPPATNWTWNDFVDIAHVIYRETGVRTVPVFVRNPRIAVENQLRQTGRTLFDHSDDGTLGFADPALLESFFRMQLDLHRDAVLVDPETVYRETELRRQPLIQGTSWVGFYWSNEFEALRELADRPLGLALLPRVSAAYRPGAFLKPSMFFSISKESANPDAAAQFIDFFLNDKRANSILRGERGIPIVPSMRAVVGDTATPAMQQVLEFVALVEDGNQTPIDPPDPAGAGHFQHLLRETTGAVLSGSMSPEAGAARILAWDLPDSER